MGESRLRIFQNMARIEEEKKETTLSLLEKRLLYMHKA